MCERSWLHTNSDKYIKYGHSMSHFMIKLGFSSLCLQFHYNYASYCLDSPLIWINGFTISLRECISDMPFPGFLFMCFLLSRLFFQFVHLPILDSLVELKWQSTFFRKFPLTTSADLMDSCSKFQKQFKCSFPCIIICYLKDTASFSAL